MFHLYLIDNLIIIWCHLPKMMKIPLNTLLNLLQAIPHPQCLNSPVSFEKDESSASEMQVSTNTAVMLSIIGSLDACQCIIRNVQFPLVPCG